METLTKGRVTICPDLPAEQSHIMPVVPAPLLMVPFLSLRSVPVWTKNSMVILTKDQGG